MSHRRVETADKFIFNNSASRHDENVFIDFLGSDDFKFHRSVLVPRLYLSNKNWCIRATEDDLIIEKLVGGVFVTKFTIN